jgi:hypothetical protein
VRVRTTDRNATGADRDTTIGRVHDRLHLAEMPAVPTSLTTTSC